ncbi:HpcH/HpaI aldolase/citrate lyase family protein [Deinococcus sonorensis]|uniref:HpcH/HpaI aldolase/citrate lyase family protein n=2 Tax=Deinococcus sonorensis TaxID=309891 RepID=A0AAU7UC64_9DEIO
MTRPASRLPSAAPTFDPLALGASLYAPATRPDLAALGNGEKAINPHSLIYCLEDAVRDDELPLALERLRSALPQLRQGTGPLRFVRVRSPRMLETVLGFEGRSALHGVVLPKVSRSNLREYLQLLPPELSALPTLETREVFSQRRMEGLRDFLLDSGFAGRVACLRVGGNDLLSLLGLRRTPGQTVHEGPLSGTLQMLVSTFVPWGFQLSSPVYEVYGDPSTLAREVQQDRQRGLCGKTVIHPVQVAVVAAAYQVTAAELRQARAVLDPQAPAVFARDGAMCEPATHGRWAAQVLRMAQLYGVQPDAAPA